jgi:voltage-gated potassium channel
MYENIKKRTSELLSKANITDKPSQYVDTALFILILLNIIAVCLESIQDIGNKYQKSFYYFEMFSVFIFGIEYLLRVWSAPAREDLGESSSFIKRFKYIFSFTGLVDFIAIIPSIITYFGGLDLRWLRVLRLLRLLKISNYSSAIEDFFSAIMADWRSFSAALYLVLVALFLSSALMYIAENESQPDKFSSIPETMWWSLITLTTVGYGDVSPITPFGKIIGAFTAIMGVCTVALLTGIVASAFANQRAQRTAILEAEINQALSDGVISDMEAKKIEKLRKELNLSPEHSRSLMKILSEKK